MAKEGELLLGDERIHRFVDASESVWKELRPETRELLFAMGVGKKFFRQDGTVRAKARRRNVRDLGQLLKPMLLVMDKGGEGLNEFISEITAGQWETPAQIVEAFVALLRSRGLDPSNKSRMVEILQELAGEGAAEYLDRQTEVTRRIRRRRRFDFRQVAPIILGTIAQALASEVQAAQWEEQGPQDLPPPDPGAVAYDPVQGAVGFLRQMDPTVMSEEQWVQVAAAAAQHLAPENPRAFLLATLGYLDGREAAAAAEEATA